MIKECIKCGGENILVSLVEKQLHVECGDCKCSMDHLKEVKEFNN